MAGTRITLGPSSETSHKELMREVPPHLADCSVLTSEAQRGEATYLRAHSQQTAQLGFGPRATWLFCDTSSLEPGSDVDKAGPCRMSEQHQAAGKRSGHALARLLSFPAEVFTA